MLSNLLRYLEDCGEVDIAVAEHDLKNGSITQQVAVCFQLDLKVPKKKGKKENDIAIR